MEFVVKIYAFKVWIKVLQVQLPVSEIVTKKVFKVFSFHFYYWNQLVF